MLKLDEMQARAEYVDALFAKDGYDHSHLIHILPELTSAIKALLDDRARIRVVVLDERALAVSAGRADVVTYLDSVLRRLDE